MQESLGLDRPGSLRFTGCEAAELFTREIAESLQGVLALNYRRDDDPYMPGYVTASVDGRYWHDTMWTRDAGVFLRELVLWGYFRHACLLADCLIRLVDRNEEGYYTFPMYFQCVQPAAGRELDGTGAIVIGLALLWHRLPEGDPCKARIYRFLHQEASPPAYIHARLANVPLVAGSGEFGGGMGIEGDWCNVVQNNLLRLALLAVAGLEQVAGDEEASARYRQDAARLGDNMGRLLIGEDGSWLWCIHPESLAADPAVLDSHFNKGFGGINGVACMHADVLDLEPLRAAWPGITASVHTFARLLAAPLRREQFEKYGIWTQFDLAAEGLLTSPSYGHLYALQTMLLFDRLEMAGQALGYLAQATYAPPAAYQELARRSPYHFYERYYSPDYTGRMEQGCGALNLVNVAEPAKAARLIVGVDDLATGEVKIIPRLPPGWAGYAAENWPIRTSDGVVRADLTCERQGEDLRFSLRVRDGAVLPAVAVRLPAQGGHSWHRSQGVSAITV